MVKVLDFQSRGLIFEITGWLQNDLSLSSFQGWSIAYQEFLETYCENVKYFIKMALTPAMGQFTPLRETNEKLDL